MSGNIRKRNALTARYFELIPSGSTSGNTISEISTDGTMAGNSDSAVPTEKAVKTYVDSTSTGLTFKNAVEVATTTAGTLATSFADSSTVDGVTLSTGDRILIKDQSDSSENGVYVVAATGAPSRATDFDTDEEVAGAVVPVKGGTVNADSAWICVGDSVVVDTDDITFSLFGGVKAGTGLSLTADVMSIDTATTVDLSTSQTLTNKTVTSPYIDTSALIGDSTESFVEITYVDANSGTLSGTSGTISTQIPAGALILGVSMNNDVATTDDDGDDTYTAAFSGGSSVSINGGSAIAAAQNTKTTEFFDVNGATGITSDVTDITLTPNGTNFTAGDVRAVVVYMEMQELNDV